MPIWPAAVERVNAEDLERPDALAWTNGLPLFDLISGQCDAHYEQHMADLRAIAGQDVV